MSYPVSSSIPSHFIPSKSPEEFFKLGIGFYEEEDFQMAANNFRLAADQGHAMAQFMLGTQYQNGEGIDQDDEEAIKYIRLSATQGYANAQYSLGICYLVGQGVESDDATAVKYLKLAADQGIAAAQCALGDCYFFGRGIIPDDMLAVKYYQLAADQGIAEALGCLGDCYREGRGVKQDDERAIEFYQRAAEEEELDEQRIEALLGRAILYDEGYGVTKNPEMAFKLYKFVADQGNASARCQVGVRYYTGQGVQQDYVKAADYFQMAAIDDDATALCYLGDCFCEGLGVEKNDWQAQDYYRHAVAEGSQEAKERLLTRYNITLSEAEQPKLKSTPAQEIARPGPQIVNTQMTLELAFFKGDDDFIHRLLGTESYHRLPSEPITGAVEGYYTRRLMQAHKKGFVEEEIVYLIKMGNFLAGVPNYIQASKVLNGALALVLKNKPSSPFQKYLFQQLANLESSYNIQYGIKNYQDAEMRILNYRKRLGEIRAQAKKALDLKEPIENIQQTLTEGLKDLLRDHITAIQKLLGKPPVKWACIGLGSMSRGEMCPNSDVEFTFLIEEKTPKALEYFRKLSHIFYLQIINLGETKLNIFEFDKNHPSATPSGFSLDIGGNTPLNDEIVGTPKMIAQIQIDTKKHTFIIRNALSSACFIAGEEKLLANYTKAYESAMETRDKQETKIRDALTFELLEQHLEEFKPNLSKDREMDAFGIKKELYRPFQNALGCLAIFFALKEKNTFRRLDELEKLGVLSSKGAENVKKALRSVLTLRVEAHLFYEDETEHLLHLPLEKEAIIRTNDEKDFIGVGLSLGSTKSTSELYLEGKRLEAVMEIYKVLIPFHKSTEEFFKSKSKDAFQNNNFYDDSPSTQAITYEKTFQYSQAQELFQQAVSLNPHDLEALLSLGRIEAREGKSNEALKRFEKGLVLAKEKYGENHPELAACYNHIGAVYESLKDYKKALEPHQKALKILMNAWGETHPFVATSYQNVGIVYENLKEYEKALEYYQKALKIRLALYGENDSSVFESSRACDQLTIKQQQGDEKSLEPDPVPLKSTPLTITKPPETKIAEVKSVAPQPSAPQLSAPQLSAPQLSAPQLPAPAIAFGKEQWITYFGDVGVVPPLPHDIDEILKSPCPFWPGKRVEETHLLVLIPKTIKGQLLTLKNLKDLVQHPQKGNPTRYRYFFDCDKYAGTPIDEPYWVLMTRDILPDSRHKAYDSQKKMITSLTKKAQLKYQVPTLLEASVCIFMEYFRSGTHLYPIKPDPQSYALHNLDTYTRCQEMKKKGRQLRVGKFAQDGLQIDQDSGVNGYDIGIGAISRLDNPMVSKLHQSSGSIPKQREEKASKSSSSPQISLQQPPVTLPPIAFGKAKWEKYIGDIGVEPPLPPDINRILSSPCPFWPGKRVEETHCLMLIPKTVNKWPLTLRSLEGFVKNPRQGNPTQFVELSSVLKFLDKEVKESYWILMTKDVLPETRDTGLDSQIKQITKNTHGAKKKYSAPKAIEAAICAMMHFVETKTFLYGLSNIVDLQTLSFINTFTHCKEEVAIYSLRTHVIVGGFGTAGLCLQNFSEYKNQAVGLAAVRKF